MIIGKFLHLPLVGLNPSARQHKKGVVSDPYNEDQSAEHPGVSQVPLCHSKVVKRRKGLTSVRVTTHQASIFLLLSYNIVSEPISSAAQKRYIYIYIGKTLHGS